MGREGFPVHAKAHMQMILKKQFTILVLVPMIFFLVFGLARQWGVIYPGQFAIPKIWHSILFILSAITAIAGPILCRALFAHAMRTKTCVPTEAFLSFQKKILWISQTTLYLAFIAVFCDFPRFHAAAIVLMALYAVYYYFPSQQRILFDKKIFRVFQ